MISTISMRIEQPRQSKPIPTKTRPSGTTGLIIATVLGAMLVCFVLFGHRLVHAADTPANAASIVTADSAEAAGSLEQARAAVTSLPSFPPAYPAAAGIAP